MSESIEATSSQTINVLIVIDTDYVKQHYGPNQNSKDSPQGIDHNSQFMICTGSRSTPSGQATATLSFSANPGDYVSFAGTSIYANSDDAVIVYGIKYWSGDNVFNNFVADSVTLANAVQPDATSIDGLPPLHVPATFLTYDSKVAKKGTENFYVYFALYTLASDGETQNLYGYYYWDPQIVVN